jgi:hypothetical protein
MGLLNSSDIQNPADDRHNESGMALVTALLATTILLALGVAIVFSSTMDTVTTKNARVSEQAFFAADAGIGIARKAMAKAFEDRLSKLKTDLAAKTVSLYSNTPDPTDPTHNFPIVQVLPDPDTTDGQSCSFYSDIITNAVSLSNDTTRNTKMYNLNGTSFTVAFSPFSGKLDLIRTPGNASKAVQSMVFRYTVTVTGRTDAGGTATVSETGRVTSDLTLTTKSTITNTRNFSFSGFGAFFDYGDTQANAPLASGTFSGPVHTNTHFAFLSSRSVAFRNVVSQVDDKMRYDDTSTTNPNHAIPTADITGIDISAEGYKQTDPVPLPANEFSQEYAVINSTGITDLKSDGTPVDPPGAMPTSPATVFDSSGRVTAAALQINLRNASGNKPTISGSSIAQGVYISSTDGTTIGGSGIYVQGDASDIQLYADTNGDQVYVIKQGSTTTTVTTSFSNNTTTITTGSSTRTLTGVFKDKADPNVIKNGAMLYVNGAISKLRGGKDSSGTKPAVSASTRLTITAQGDITVAGDLKYAQPVSNSDGSPVSGIGSITNVLGIFTNDGNVNLAPESTYVGGSGLSLEMNAAVVSFNANTSNDGGQIKGSIVFTGSTTPGTNDRWRLVGSRVQSKINSIGYNFRDIYFDTRFQGGTFAPPFFPGTTYKLAAVPTSTDITIASFSTPAASAMSGFRTNK